MRGEMIGGTSARSRAILLRTSVLVVCGVAVAFLWLPWHSDRLSRPESGFARRISVGIGDGAPPDTRVFLGLDPWNEYRRPTLRLILGQSQESTEQTARFRIEFDGFLIRPESDRCSGFRTPNTCWSGDGMVTESESTQGAPVTVVSGTFLPSGFTAIETSPLLGAAANGPYRSLYEEITALPDPQPGLSYPARGVEIEIFTGVGSDQARYESFFPDQPYRLYPDGWAWLLPEPGGPVGMQITDINLEQRLRRRSDIAGLFMGVFLALFVQIAYELVHDLWPLPGQSRAVEGKRRP